MGKRILVLILGVGLVGALLAPWLHPQLVLWAHRRAVLGTDPGRLVGDWWLAERRQLHSPEWGPGLLKDARVVEHRVEQLASSDEHGGDQESLIKYRGEWALMFAAMRLQGKDNAQILAGPHGLQLTLATLAAESDPPRWWQEARWLQEAARAQPHDDFRLGLVAQEQVSELVARAGKLDTHQLPALVHAVLRLQSGFTRADRDAVLQAWLTQQGQYFSPNNALSVKTALAARQSLRELADPLAQDGLLAVRVVAAGGFTPEQAAVATEAARDFLRSCGYRLSEGEGLRLEVGLEEVTFEEVATDTFRPFTTTERVQVGSSSLRVGNFSVSQPRYAERERVKLERESKVGETRMVTTVVVARAGDRTLQLKVPPYGNIEADKVTEILELIQKPQLSSSEAFNLNWYLKQTATAPWRFGLALYEREWNVEDSW